MSITAHQIEELLAEKHNDDVFVAECKNGPSQWGGHLRLDGWAMTRSWAKPRSIGYEIKVSRSDFLRDNKLEQYMEYCHQFYIVAPVGVVMIEELPAGAGLMVPTKNAARLLTKVKAPVRKIDWPVDLLRYILIARIREVPRADVYVEPSAREQWTRWMEKRAENKTWGHQFAGKLRKIVEERIDEVGLENNRLREENESLREIKDYMAELGVPVGRLHRWRIKDRLEEIQTGFSKDFRRTVNSMIDQLTRINSEIDGEGPRASNPT